MSSRPREHQESEREQERAAMLREALSRPGIREVMQVYQGWQRLDHGIDPYRAATKRQNLITTTDHANAR